MQLRRAGSLDSDGLYALGDAAWWLGLIRETIEICEECHERFLAEGRLDRAAMVALETGFHWMMRGEPEVGSGWLSRARRLLEGQGPSVAQGFLLWMDSAGRFGAGDVEGALAGAVELQRMAHDLEEPLLGCFGLALEGIIAIRGGEPARGWELLDEAMLPVLAGRIGPGESGNLYCQMISLCTDLGDVARARRWTEVTERWCDLASSAVMFTGICRVHRAQLLRVAGRPRRRGGGSGRSVRRARRPQRRGRRRGPLRDRRDAAAAGRPRRRAHVVRRRSSRSAARRSPAGRCSCSSRAGPTTPTRRSAAHSPSRATRSAGLGFSPPRWTSPARAATTSTADAATDELESIAETYASAGFRAWADTARGAVLIGRGSPAAAVGPLRAALTALAAMGATYDENVARTLLGRALQPEPAALPADLPGGLTAREWEILSAVTEGLSNREVAARLVISEKTVARHLANVFAKLEVPSRTAAAAWARTRSLMQDLDARDHAQFSRSDRTRSVPSVVTPPPRPRETVMTITTEDQTPVPSTPAAAEEFAERMFGVFNDSALCLLVSVGHQVGLFDTMSALPPSTSDRDRRGRRAWTSATSASGSAA